MTTTERLAVVQNQNIKRFIDQYPEFKQLTKG
jgi:ammonia channel protein AmtB